MKLKPKQKTTKQGKICELGVKKDDLRRLAKICKLRVHSHRRCSGRKGILRNFAKFTRKHLCLSLFFNKVAG